jgi:hypothetical protein
VAASEMREFEEATVLDAIRQVDGSLHLDALARRFATLVSGDFGLQVDRQAPGCGEMLSVIRKRSFLRFCRL